MLTTTTTKLLVAFIALSATAAFAPAPIRARTTTTTTSPLFLFGFGGDAESDEEKRTKEVFRMDKVSSDIAKYGSLVEYVKEWSELLASSKRLTTPIQVDSTDSGTQIIFVPRPGTGKYYRSADEDREADKKGMSKRNASAQEVEEEGGVEISVDESLSVTAKRFNYGEDTTIKEMSEETIVGQLKEALNTWKKERN